jgi:hypothetical protein
MYTLADLPTLTGLRGLYVNLGIPLTVRPKQPLLELTSPQCCHRPGITYRCYIGYTLIRSPVTIPGVYQGVAYSARAIDRIEDHGQSNRTLCVT